MYDNTDLISLLKKATKNTDKYEMTFGNRLNPRWKYIMTKGYNKYYEDVVTGKRKVWLGHVYSAIDWEWVMKNES